MPNILAKAACWAACSQMAEAGESLDVIEGELGFGFDNGNPSAGSEAEEDVQE